MIIDREDTTIGSSSKVPSARDVQVCRGMTTSCARNAVEVEAPPPYVRNPAAAASASGLLQPSAVSRPPPPLPPRSQFLNSTATNYLFIKTRDDPITGIYNIDPQLDTVVLGKDGVSAHERRSYNQKHQQRHRHHKRKGFLKRAELPEPHAIFGTRNGGLKLDLGVVASPGSSQSRARIQAATKHGLIKINVLTVHAQRHINLEVSSRKGDVHILIPRSFSGYIQLYSGSGNLSVLPSLNGAMQLVYRRGKEMQMLAGNAARASMLEKASNWTGDSIHAATHRGNIIIGYLGEDTIPTAGLGLWKRLADFFHR